MYKPGTLKDSNIISAVYSRFSGVFKGGSVYKRMVLKIINTQMQITQEKIRKKIYF